MACKPSENLYCSAQILCYMKILILIDFVVIASIGINGDCVIYYRCLDLFTRSCAGSCVVTYLMGIGDR
jgi:hypothetical protein